VVEPRAEASGPSDSALLPMDGPMVGESEVPWLWCPGRVRSHLEPTVLSARHYRSHLEAARSMVRRLLRAYPQAYSPRKLLAESYVFRALAKFMSRVLWDTSLRAWA